jgi:hypothetical protein
MTKSQRRIASQIHTSLHGLLMSMTSSDVEWKALHVAMQSVYIAMELSDGPDDQPSRACPHCGIIPFYTKENS